MILIVAATIEGEHHTATEERAWRWHGVTFAITFLYPLHIWEEGAPKDRITSGYEF